MTVAFSARIRREREPSFRETAIKVLAVLTSLVVLVRHGHFGWFPFVAAAIIGLPRVWRDRTRVQNVVASDAGLQLDGELVARDAIGTAFTLHDPLRLRVETPNMVYEIPCSSAKRATRVMRAIGHGDRAMRFGVVRASSPSSNWTLVVILVIVAGVYGAAVAARDHFGLFLGGLLGLAMVAAIVQQHRRRAEAVVGIDGLSIEQGRQRRFFPWSTVRGASAESGSVTVDVGDGPLHLSMTTGRRDGKAASRATALVASIAAARERFASAPEPPRIEELGRGAFRTTHVADETLWHALASARTPPDERVAAAMILRTRVTDDDLRKVRVAADACAAPVRDRIRAVLDAEDEDLDALANTEI